MEKRPRGVADSLFRRGTATARLRNQEVNRATLRRNGPLPRGLALPAALSPRTAWLDTRALDRKKRPAPASLLPSDQSGAKGSRLTTSRLARICRRHPSHHGDRKCVNGSLKFSAAL